MGVTTLPGDQPEQTDLLGALADSLGVQIPDGVPQPVRTGEPDHPPTQAAPRKTRKLTTLPKDRADHPPGLGNRDHPPSLTTLPDHPPQTTLPGLTTLLEGTSLAGLAGRLRAAPDTPATGRAWVLVMDWDRLPWSLNDYWNRFKVAKEKKSIRETGQLLALEAGIDRVERLRVTLHWLPKQSRTRDAENPAPTLKALCDGLVDAGVVDDDDPWRMVKLMPVIYLPIKGERARLWLVLEELEAVVGAPPCRGGPRDDRPVAVPVDLGGSS